MVDGDLKTLLVHRKGATRAFPPHHPLIPVDYQFTGQPVIVGGTMGTCSYVLTGTQKGMAQTFGSTCHGAGRAKSRNESRWVRGGGGEKIRARGVNPNPSSCESMRSSSGVAWAVCAPFDLLPVGSLGWVGHRESLGAVGRCRRGYANRGTLGARARA